MIRLNGISLDTLMLMNGVFNYDFTTYSELIDGMYDVKIPYTIQLKTITCDGKRYVALYNEHVYMELALNRFREIVIY